MKRNNSIAIAVGTILASALSLAYADPPTTANGQAQPTQPQAADQGDARQNLTFDRKDLGYDSADVRSDRQDAYQSYAGQRQGADNQVDVNRDHAMMPDRTGNDADQHQQRKPDSDDFRHDGSVQRAGERPLAETADHGDRTDIRADQHDVYKDRTDIRADRADIQKDRTDIQNDRAEIRSDRQDLHRDYAAERAGKNEQADISKDRADIRADYQDMNRDRADIRADRRDLHGDVADVRADRSDLRSDQVHDGQQGVPPPRQVPVRPLRPVPGATTASTGSNVPRTAPGVATASSAGTTTASGDFSADQRDIYRDRADIRADGTDIRKDRMDIRSDRADIRSDRQDLHRDYAAERAGKNEQADIAKDRADIRADYQDVNRDRADIRADRRDLHGDVADVRADQRDVQADRMRTSHHDLGSAQMRPDMRADHDDLRSGERTARSTGSAFDRGVTTARLGSATGQRDLRESRGVADARQGRTVAQAAGANKGLTPQMLADNARSEARKPPATKATHKAWYHWWW